MAIIVLNYFSFLKNVQFIIFLHGSCFLFSILFLAILFTVYHSVQFRLDSTKPNRPVFPDHAENPLYWAVIQSTTLARYTIYYTVMCALSSLPFTGAFIHAYLWLIFIRKSRLIFYLLNFFERKANKGNGMKICVTVKLFEADFCHSMNRQQVMRSFGLATLELGVLSTA